MPSPSRRAERARPLLGTVVRIRVEGLEPAPAHHAIDGAFAIVADIHRAMSFHEAGSELSRINREAWRTPVRVGGHTQTVLERALEIARASAGLFDPTVAPALVRTGLLPAPEAPAPDPAASWRDIEVNADGAVRFARPLWIDLGGVAKGYAVDRAVSHIASFGPSRICVEAGGDLRLTGPGAERVHLAAPRQAALPALEVENAAVASSGPNERGASPHIDPRTGRACPIRFASVAAPRCLEADALTKVVMAAGASAAAILARYGAKAFLFEDDAWIQIAEAA